MRFFLILALLVVVPAAKAQDLSAFAPGPLISDFGMIAEIEGREPLPTQARFRISFDVVNAAEPGKESRSFNAGARFLNMHAAAGVKPRDMQLAFVVHGKAVHDVLKNNIYRNKIGTDNKNAALIKALQKHGVEIHVCGQSAAAYGVATEDLLPGVKMALSAMTMHALLQQNGYTLNPF